jgi:hypothetical protein
MARIAGWGTASSPTCGTRWGGEFTVNDIAADLSRLSVTYRLTCGLEATANGEIRINSPADPELLVAADTVAFPDRYPGSYGYGARVTLINTGAEDVTVTDVAVTDGAADFQLPDPEYGPLCPSIPVGGSCAFSVGFSPAAAGPRTGTVTITDSTSAGAHTVRLSGTGIGGHSFWGTHTQVDDTADEEFDRAVTPPDNASMFAGGDAQKVNLVLREHTSNAAYRAEFRGSPDAPLLHGTTHTNGLHVTNWGHCDSPTGTFTVHEAAYDADGEVTKFSVTFEQHCEGRVAGTFGSIAWRADNPAQPVGGIVGVVPDAVMNLTAKPARGSVALWRTATSSP